MEGSGLVIERAARCHPPFAGEPQREFETIQKVSVREIYHIGGR
jgi:hypothetical protein